MSLGPRLVNRWYLDPPGPMRGPWRLSLAPDQSLPADTSAWQLFHRGPHSRLYQLPGELPRLVKLIVPRSQPRDSLRKYVNAQGLREYRSARCLQAIGLQAPQVYGWGLSLSPGAAYESCLVMAHVSPYQSALRFIRESTDAEQRAIFFARFATELAQLHGHGLIHKDGHFDNLGRSNGPALIWVDNDIRAARRPQALKHGFARTLALLHNTARSAVSSDEWQYFHHCLRHELRQWPLARNLADEV